MKRYLLAAVLTALLLDPIAQGADRQDLYLTFSARDQNRIYFRDLKKEEVALYLDDQPCRDPILRLSQGSHRLCLHY